MTTPGSDGRASGSEAGPRGLAGRLLVATPALEDPNFRRTVVLLVDHSDEGALGVVLNRPLGVDLLDVLPGWYDVAATPRTVFSGGPVSRESALCLGHVRVGVATDGRAVRIADDSPLGLVDLDADPSLVATVVGEVRVFAGYAGWGAGQLDTEIGDGAWIVVQAEPGDAFCGEAEDLWARVLQRQPGTLRWLASYPDDPALN